MRKSTSKRKRDWANKEGSKYTIVMKKEQADARPSGEKNKSSHFSGHIIYTAHVICFRYAKELGKTNCSPELYIFLPIIGQ